METIKIKEELINNHLQFCDILTSLTEQEFLISNENKWNASQHLDHITKSVAILSKAFSYPKWLLKYKFGKANRPSRNKQELINRYLEKLKTAKATPSPFQGKNIDFNQRKDAFANLNKHVNKLIKRSNKYSEKDLDMCIIPHPLLGKLTCREMLYFTSYHVEHHTQLVKKYTLNIENKS